MTATSTRLCARRKCKRSPEGKRSRFTVNPNERRKQIYCCPACNVAAFREKRK